MVIPSTADERVTTTLVTGASASAREQAIARLIEAQLTTQQQNPPLAVILEGIHARHLSHNTVGEGFDDVAPAVPVLVERGLRHLGTR